jgi:hypothetical protein
LENGCGGLTTAEKKEKAFGFIPQLPKPPGRLATYAPNARFKSMVDPPSGFQSFPIAGNLVKGWSASDALAAENKLACRAVEGTYQCCT